MKWYYHNTSGINTSELKELVIKINKGVFDVIVLIETLKYISETDVKKLFNDHLNNYNWEFTPYVLVVWRKHLNVKLIKKN